jgi:hypothetical protein
MSAGNDAVLLAHGIGGRVDLPVPSWLAVYAGGVVVAITFFVVISMWTTPRFSGTAGIAVPRLQRVIDAQVVTALVRVVGVVILVLFLLTAWAGRNDGGLGNPSPTWLYVWFWVGLVPLSIACGPVWKQMNPLRSLAGAARWILRSTPRQLPQRLAYWPAVASLVAFLWLELVDDESASPRAVALFVTVYAVVHVLAGTAYGQAWFDRGDGFDVYSQMIAYASPWGRRTDGQLILRNPLEGLTTVPTSPNLTPVVLTVLGSTAFDGLSRSGWWAGLVGGTDRAAYLWLGTIGIAATLAAVTATYGVAVWATGRFMGTATRPSAQFAHTLVPIAIGYTVAHYFSFAVFQGQQGLLLANDPLGRGWNLFGLRGASVDYFLLSATTIALVQVSAIVIGHAVAVVSAHDKALAVLPGNKSRSGQYPLLIVMILYTTVGIMLVSRG